MPDTPPLSAEALLGVSPDQLMAAIEQLDALIRRMERCLPAETINDLLAAQLALRQQ